MQSSLGTDDKNLSGVMTVTMGGFGKISLPGYQEGLGSQMPAYFRRTQFGYHP